MNPKFKVKHNEPVARLDVGYRCLMCNQPLGIVLMYMKAGHGVYQCCYQHCASFEKQVKIPLVTMKGEWL